MKVESLNWLAKLTSAALAALLLSACQKPLSFEEPVMPPLTVSISSLLRFPVHYSGTEELIYEFSPQISGFDYFSAQGHIKYNGSEIVPAQSDLTVTVSDGVSQDILKVKLNVVQSKASDITWDESKKYIEVPNQSVVFHFAKGEPDEAIEFSFDGLNHFPDPPKGVVRLTPNFRITSPKTPPMTMRGRTLPFRLDAMWPVKGFVTKFDATRLSVFTYAEYEFPNLTSVAVPGDAYPENRWVYYSKNKTHFSEGLDRVALRAPHFYDDKEWISISHIPVNEVSFIGLLPKQACLNIKSLGEHNESILGEYSGSRPNRRA